MGIEKFKAFVDELQKSNDYKAPLGFGIARVDIGKKSKAVLCATYPVLNWSGENLGTYAVLCECAKEAEKLTESENEAVYGINQEFVNRALELYAPFLSEALGNNQSHKNIQVILELKKLANKGKLKTKGGRARYRFCVIYKDEKCESVESAYMKLLALSLGKTPLRSLQLDGIFGLLQNVAWSGNKPYELEWLRENEIRLKMEGIYPQSQYLGIHPPF